MRHEYMDVPPPTDTHRPYLERELYEKALSRILDRAISLDGVKGESSMDYETLIESLRPYATSIQTKEYSFETVCYIRLQKISMIVNASDSRVRIVNDIRLTIHSFGDTSYMKAVLLLDAAMDAVLGSVTGSIDGLEGIDIGALFGQLNMGLEIPAAITTVTFDEYNIDPIVIPEEALDAKEIYNKDSGLFGSLIG